MRIEILKDLNPITLKRLNPFIYMHFTRTQPTSDVDLIAWESESSRYKIGFYRVLFGVRVVLSDPQGGIYLVNYCLGNDFVQAVSIFNILRIALLLFPEQCDPQTISEFFPRQSIKPLVEDADCNEQLVSMLILLITAHRDVADRMERYSEDSFDNLVNELKQRYQQRPKELQALLSKSHVTA